MNVLMVCLGNICRSPMAQGLLNHLKQHTSTHVDSAGESNYHQGEAPDKRAVHTMQLHGIDISRQQSRPFESEDFNRFDLILVMDKSNYRGIVSKATTEEQKSKVKLILSYIDSTHELEVPDPYYGNGDGFRSVYTMLEQACQTIVKQYKL